MRLLFLIWFILTSFLSVAQNGGQFSQNDVVSVSYLGYENNIYLFKITNKLDCNVEVRYRFEQTPNVDTTILANSSVYIPISYRPLPSVSFTVKPIPQTVCILGGSQVDMGLLEIEISAVLDLQPSGFTTNVRNTSNINICIERGILKTDVGNNTFLQVVIIYDVNGRILFKDRRVVNKQCQIPINSHLTSGQNFIIVHIENKLKDVFLLKYYN